MLAHDFLDRFCRLICVVEGDSADIVVQNMRLYYTVQELTTDEAEFSIDRCRSSSSVVPGIASVVRKRWIGVLQESDGD